MSSFGFSANLIGWTSSFAIHAIVIIAAWMTLPLVLPTSRPEVTGHRSCVQLTAAWAEPREDQPLASSSAMELAPPAAEWEARAVASPRRTATERVVTEVPAEIALADCVTVVPPRLPPLERSTRIEPRSADESARRLPRQPPQPTLPTRSEVVVPPISSHQSSIGAEYESPPLPWHNPSPPYPASAVTNRWAGITLLRVYIEADGRVARVQLISSSGHNVLDAAAVGTVEKWRFRPARAGDRPIATTIRQPVRFSLD